MNKHLHRIVFNAARGLRMVVQETARSTGRGTRKATSGGAGAGSAAVSVAAITAALMSSPLHAQIVADPHAPGGQRPTVLGAPNGVPVVNIQTPSAAGVSRNTYSQFDVQHNGVVLNNSRGNAQTQLGGWVQGNPWLATGSARVILNEVNSANPSQLRGYVEVAGPRTEVIIANPAGIQVDGGGFINVNRATLTTGTPQFNAQGGLDSFVVRGGNVSIDGAGLDAAKTDYAAILARAVQVNAGLWANELKVVTGANQVSADSSQTSPTAGSGAAPSFALDVAALGGMYAGKITLVGTEAGVGVRNAGHIGAGAGGLVVTAAGRLENTGTLEGAKVELSSASDIDNRGGTIRQAGTRDISVTAPVLSNTQGGFIGAEPVATSTGSGGDAGTSAGTSSEGDASGGSGGATPSTTTGTTTAAAVAGIAEATPVQPPAATGAGAITAAGSILNDGGKVYVGGPIALQTPNVNNDGGTLNVASMALSGPTFSNAGGTLNVTNVFSANVGTFNNAAGKLQAGSMAIATTGDLNNQGGTLASGSTTALSVGGGLDNSNGTISAVGALNAAVAGAIDNTSGKFAGNDAVIVAAGSLNNTLGAVQSAGSSASLNVANQFLNDRGSVGAATDLSIRAGSLANSGTLRAENDSTINVVGAISNDGSVTSGRGTTIAAGSLSGGASGVLGAGIKSDGTLGASGDLAVNTTGSLQAAGTVLAVGDISVQGTSTDLTGSRVSAANVLLAATQGHVTTSSATVTTPGTLTVQANASAGQSLVNDAGVLSAGQLDLQASNLQNMHAGQIVQTGAGATTIAVTGTLDNTGGRIASNGQDLALGASTLRNTGGTIQHAGNGTLAIDAATFSGANGSIVSNGGLIVQAGTFNQDGGSTSAKQISIDAADISNRAGSIVQSGTGATRIAASGALTNDGGTIATNGADLRLAAGGTLSNVSGKLQHAGTGALNIAADSYSGASGEITTNGALVAHVSGAFNQDGGATSAQQISIDAGSISNVAGTVTQTGTGDTHIAATGKLVNDGGTIASNGNALSLTVGGTLSNNNGHLRHAGTGTFGLTAGDYSGAGGEMLGNGQIVAQVRGALAQDGGTISARQVSIDAASISNRAGQIVQTDSGTLHAHVAGTLDNTAGLIGTTTGSGGAVDLKFQAIANQGGRISSDRDLLVESTGDLRNDAGVIRAAGNLAVRASGTVTNAQGTIEAAGAASSLSLQAAQIDNTEGRVANGGIGDTTLTASAITNTAAAANGGGGLIAGNGNVVVNATNLNNLTNGVVTSGKAMVLGVAGTVTNRGTIASSGALTFSEANANLDNTAGGEVTAAGDLRIAVNGVRNDGGRIATTDGSGGNLAVITNTFSNHGGTLASDRDLQLVLPGSYVNESLLHAGRNLTLSLGGDLTNTATGTLEAVGTLHAEVGGQMTNAQGGVVQAQNVDLHVVGALSNSGEITGNTVNVSADSVVNTGNGAITGGDVTLSARAITNQGAQALIAATGDVSLWVSDSLSNLDGATIYGGRDIYIGANGALNADGYLANATATVVNSASTIEAERNIDIAANALLNERPGVAIEQVQSLDETHTLSMPSWWHNSDNNKSWYNPAAGNYIPYEVYYVNPADILESSTVVTPDGYQVTRVVIKTHANDTAFFSARAGRDGAYGHRERITMTDGTMVLYALGRQDGAPNPDQVAGITSGVWQGEANVVTWDAPAPAFDAAYGNCSTDCVRFYAEPAYTDPNGIMIRGTQVPRGPYTSLSELSRTAHTTAVDDQLASGAGATGRIVAGGDIRIGFAGSVTNRYGEIMAGAQLKLQGVPGSTVDNVATTLYRRYAFDGVRHYADGVNVTYTQPEISMAIGSVSGVLSGAQGVSITGGAIRNIDTSAGSAANIVDQVRLTSGGTPGSTGPVGGATGSGASAASGTSASAVNATAGPGGVGAGTTVPVRTPGGGSAGAVPSGGLFTAHPASTSRYLFETRSAFADYRNWASSDYFFNALGLDPDNIQKRLGDGFYEQKLIREQIAELTGRRYLSGYGDDDTQYLELMKAGTTFAEQYGLRPGIALSAEQMKALTSDIVWMETQTVTLPDGSTQQVLVPKVYLAQVGANAVKPNGALITGDNVYIEGDSIVNRGGTIGGTGTQRAVLVASADIVNQGGTLQAGQLRLQAGGSIRNETLTVSQNFSQSDGRIQASGSHTSLSNVGRIEATDQLQIQAGGDFIDNSGRINSDGSASIRAGGDVVFDTVTTGSSYQATIGSSSLSRESSTAQVGTLTAGANLIVTGDRDVTLNGTQVNAGGNVSLSAGRNLSIEAVTSSSASDQRNDPTGTKFRQTSSETTVQGASVKAGGSLVAVAGTNEAGNLSVIGSQLEAGGTVVLQASQDIVVADARATSSRDDFTHTSNSGFLSKKSTTDHQTETRDIAVGSSVSGKNVLLSAENDVIVTGSYVGAQEQLALSGGRDVKIQSAEDRSSQSSFHAESKSGFSASLASGVSYGKSAGNQTQTGQSTTQVGSVLSGANVSIDSGRDTQIIASAVVADDSVAITAGRNIDILQRTDTESSTNASQSSGMSLGLVSGFAPRQTLYGSLAASGNGTGESRTAVTSLISANGGSLTMVAGLDSQYKGTGQGNITTEGADLLAQNKVTLSGNAVNLNAATSSGDSTYHAESRSVTLGAQLTGTVGGQITRAYDMAQASRDTSDSRLQGAQQLKAGYDAYKLATNGALGAGIADAGAAGTNGDPGNSAFGVSVSVSSSKSRQDSAESFTNQRGTNIQAGSIDITARETDINASGAKLQARDIALDAYRDINLGAAVNTAETRGSNSGSSLGFGVTAGFGSQNGISFQLSAGSSKGTANGTEVRYDNTLVSATDTLTIRSGGDTNLVGAQLTADQVKASIGGNLNIESLQDRTEYESKQSSSGVDVSICVPPICYGQVVTASASYAKQSVDHNYQSATGQSGIAAGSGGFDITVKGNTDLKGGALTSTALIDKNSFTTGSLTTSDLTNRQNTDSRSESLSVSYGSNWSSAAANAATSVTNTALGNLNSGKGLPADKNETSQTLSVISPSNVKITGTGNAEVDAKSAENVATLTSRDASTANGALVNNLTLQQAQDIPRQQQEAADRQRAAQLVGSVIDNVIGDVSAKNGWAEGGAAKIALHGLAGIVQAKIGDGSVVTGAAAGMLNEALLPMMAEYLESQGIHRYNADGSPNANFSELLTAGSTLLGAAVGAMGGNAGLGAMVANNATVNNYLKHDDAARLKQLQDKKNSADGLTPREADEYQALVNTDQSTNQAFFSCQKSGFTGAGCQTVKADYAAVVKSYSPTEQDIDAWATKKAPGSGFTAEQLKDAYNASFMPGASQPTSTDGDLYKASDWIKGQIAVDNKLSGDGLLDKIYAGFVSSQAPMTAASFGAGMMVLPGGFKVGAQIVDALATQTIAEISTVVRVAGTDIQIIDRDGTVLRYNATADKYEPIPAIAVDGAKPSGVVLAYTRDSADNSIPVVMADTKFSWVSTGTTLQGADHERAAIAYVNATENVVAVIDARQANGNGFDPSYIKKNPDGSYQLVIVEDKSGAMGKITAFGEGARGEAQLDRNLSQLLEKIRTSDMPNDARMAAMSQIQNRTFETQLFVGPTSNPMQAQLDLLRTATKGQNAVSSIVVLPKK